MSDASNDSQTPGAARAEGAGTPAIVWLRALAVRTLRSFALAFVASVAFVVLAAEVRTGALDRLDRDVELAVHRLDAPWVDLVMLSATWLGSNRALAPVVAAVALLALHLRRRAVALVLVLDAIAVGAANAALKLLFSRARPRLFDKIDLPASPSFPSGHAMAAIGIYGVIAFVLIVLYPRTRRPVLAAAIIVMAAIGLSRVYLGVHWPSDVIAGFLGGVPPLVVSVHLLRRGRG